MGIMRLAYVMREEYSLSMDRIAPQEGIPDKKRIVHESMGGRMHVPRYKRITVQFSQAYRYLLNNAASQPWIRYFNFIFNIV